MHRPFVTIEPNIGVSFFESPCPCAIFKKQAECRLACFAACEIWICSSFFFMSLNSPRYGTCLNGTRRIPVKVLDVAGLVPGASQGLGLGNKFLDDLRVADVLLHVIDTSGTTNERGEKTVNYDPSNDADWLKQEIEEVGQKKRIVLPFLGAFKKLQAQIFLLFFLVGVWKHLPALGDDCAAAFCHKEGCCSDASGTAGRIR